MGRPAVKSPDRARSMSVSVTNLTCDRWITEAEERGFPSVSELVRQAVEQFLTNGRSDRHNGQETAAA